MEFIKSLIQFFKDVAADPKIPARDKRVILVLLALIISPVDFVPDWIPVYGLLDDFFMIAIVMDYFFNVLDDQTLLSHYPFGMKSYAAIRRTGRTLALFSPSFLMNLIWQYVPSPY